MYNINYHFTLMFNNGIFTIIILIIILSRLTVAYLQLLF